MIPGRKGRERLTHRDHCFRPGIMRFSHWFSSSARPHDWCKAASVGHNGDVHGPLIVSAGPRYARWRQTMKRRTIFSVKPRKAIRTGTARAFCETLERRVLLSGYALSQIGVFGVNASGANPQSTLAVDSIGNLYGTASRGGASGDGTVFEIAKGSGTITTLVSFDGSNGANPSAGVTLDAAGDLYGTTDGGGDSNDGTVFEIAKGSGTITTLASFNFTNGANPSAGVALDASGNLYGTTNEGTVFKIAKGSGTITTLIANGASILGGVTLDASGNLYGTTDIGGTSNDGTVFEIAKGLSTTRTLASFNGTNGEDPQAGVTLDASGNLYGTTELGGDGNGDGTVFEIAKGSGAVTTLAAFNLANGQGPAVGVTLDAAGNLYGTTSGGTETVFE